LTRTALKTRWKRAAKPAASAAIQISASNIDDLARQLGRQLKGKAAFEFISKLAEEIRKQS
jgi:hypothetical protein